MAQFAAVGAAAVFEGAEPFISELAKLGAAFGDFTEKSNLDSMPEKLNAANAGFEKFSKAALATEAAVNVVGHSFTIVTAPIRAVGDAVGEVAGAIGDGSDKIVSSLGRVAAATADLSVLGVGGIGVVGGAITTLAVAAITEGARYEKGMRDIEAISQTTGSSLDVLDESIRRVAQRFPESVGNIQRSALELEKAGVPIDAVKSKVLDLTVAMQQLGTGELSTEQAAEAIGSNLKLFESNFTEAGNTVEESADRISKSIIAIANATRAGPGEVVTGLTRLGPANEALGGNIEETAALLGTSLGPGLRGDVGGTGLRNLIQRLEAPSNTARGILEKRDISLFQEGTGAARPLIDVLLDLSDVYSKTARASSGMTDQVAEAEIAQIAQTRSGTTLRLVLENVAEKYQGYLDEIKKTDVIAQANVQNEALLNRLGVLRNEAHLAGIAFGRDFVAGLAAGTQAINDFLQQGDRLEQVAGVIGKASSAILTGKGDDQARAAVADSPFGDSGVQNFDALFASSAKVRGAIGGMLDDAGKLKDAIGKIVFPEGVLSGVDNVADGIVFLIGLGDRLINKLTELAPVGARIFQGIVDAGKDAIPFLQSLADVFTQNGGEESASKAGDAIVRFLKVVRQEAGPTIIEIAKVGRAVLDAAPEIERVAEIAVVAFGKIARFIADTLIPAINLVDLTLKRIFDTLDRLGNLKDVAINFVFSGIPQWLQNAMGAPAPTDTDVKNATIAAASAVSPPNILAALADFASPQGTLPDVRPDMRQTALGPRTSEQDLAGAAQYLADRNAAAAQDAVASSRQEAAIAEAHRLYLESHPEEDPERQRTKGGPPLPSDADAKKAAAALASAQKSLAGEQRTLDKDIADIGGSFDKTADAAQRRWLDAMNEIAISTEDTLRKIDRNLAETRRKLLETANTNVERQGGFQLSLDDQGQLQIEGDLALGQERIFRHLQEDARTIFQQGQEDRKTIRQESAEDETRDVSRHNEEITRLFSQNQEDQARIRQRGIEDQERIRQRGIEDDNTVFARGQERALESFTRAFETQNTTRLRAREDTRRDQQLARDLSAATTPEDRTKILQSFTEQKRAATEQRHDQDEDTRIARAQQDATIRFRQAQEDALTKRRREQDDTEFSHRRDLEAADINFRRLAETDLILFRRNLEDAETRRRRAAQRLEIAQSREDIQESTGFGRLQEIEGLRERALNVDIPTLQRQLNEATIAADKQIADAAENAGKSTIRARETFTREIASAVETAEQARLRLRERLGNQGESLIERSPEIAGAVSAAKAVLDAQIAISEGRITGRAAEILSQTTTITDAQINQLRAAGLDVSAIQGTFGAQANTTTSTLVSAPQVDRLTSALDNLTRALEHVPPGIHIDDVNLQVPEGSTPKAAIIGRIGPQAGS